MIPPLARLKRYQLSSLISGFELVSHLVGQPVVKQQEHHDHYGPLIHHGSYRVGVFGDGKPFPPAAGIPAHSLLDPPGKDDYEPKGEEVYELPHPRGFEVGTRFDVFLPYLVHAHLHRSYGEEHAAYQQSYTPYPVLVIEEINTHGGR